jgi:hypothetical protein
MEGVNESSPARIPLLSGLPGQDTRIGQRMPARPAQSSGDSEKQGTSTFGKLKNKEKSLGMIPRDCLERIRRDYLLNAVS